MNRSAPSVAVGGLRFARNAGALLLALLVAGACAKVAPPPGGPEDREAPSFDAEASMPPPDASAVPADETVVFVFSEPMDQRSVMRALTVFPAVDFRSANWREDTLRLVPDPGWAEGRNTTFRIGVGAKDRRGNALPAAIVRRFTTKALPDSGRLRGRVWAGREKTSTSTLLLFAVADDSTRFGPEPAAVAEPDKDGHYELDGLDTAAAWRVAALIDRDGDARPGGRDEVWRLGDARSFPPDTTALDVPDFLVGTLDSLGRIRGDVKADTGWAVGVEASDVRGDPPAILVTLPAAGPFTLDAPTGTRYRVSAFLDLDGDGKRQEEEPRVEAPDEVRLDLAAERTGLVLDLTGLGPPRPEPPPLELLDVLPADSSATTGAAPDTVPGVASPPDSTAGRGEGGGR